MKYAHIFGPVLSRRLGLSLGVDLIYHKVCSLDCIYCECGKTTDLTIKRKRFVPLDLVTAELDDYFSHHPDPDYVTFSGSGEPTLSIDLGNIISHIKAVRPHLKTAVLTNSTLLSEPDVQKELSLADIVMPSLDAVSQKTFLKINRPCKGLSIDRLIQGLKELTKNYKGSVWLEIFIIPGINDSDSELQLFKKILNEISPDRIQLNTIDRPGTLDNIRPATTAQLNRIADLFNMNNIEIISRAEVLKGNERISDHEIETILLEMIHRRPCTVSDLVVIFNRNANEIDQILKKLLSQGKIEAKTRERGIFYQTLK